MVQPASFSQLAQLQQSRPPPVPLPRSLRVPGVVLPGVLAKSPKSAPVPGADLADVDSLETFYFLVQLQGGAGSWVGIRRGVPWFPLADALHCMGEC